MKEKILNICIGILIGAIITAGGFLIFGNKSKSNLKNGNRPDMGNFTPGEMPQGREQKGENSTDSRNTQDTTSSSNTTSSTTNNNV